MWLYRARARRGSSASPRSTTRRTCRSAPPASTRTPWTTCARQGWRKGREIGRKRSQGTQAFLQFPPNSHTPMPQRFPRHSRWLIVALLRCSLCRMHVLNGTRATHVHKPRRLNILEVEHVFVHLGKWAPWARSITMENTKSTADDCSVWSNSRWYLAGMCDDFCCKLALFFYPKPLNVIQVIPARCFGSVLFLSLSELLCR